MVGINSHELSAHKAGWRVRILCIRAGDSTEYLRKETTALNEIRDGDGDGDGDEV